MDWLIGTVSFLLFFLYDWNRVFWKKRWMRGFFYLGCMGLVVSGGIFLAEALKKQSSGWIFWLAVSAVCLAGLVYTLFFALPFDETYRKEADRHKVCRTGLYGICRHPGIWWFFGCFAGAGIACADREKLLEGLFFSLLNLGYAWYQDRYIFPEEFCDYRDYQNAVPFLIPGRGQKDGKRK